MASLIKNVLEVCDGLLLITKEFVEVEGETICTPAVVFSVPKPAFVAYNGPLIPTPPDTTNAPVLYDVEVVVLVIISLPTIPTVPDTVRPVPTFKLPDTPKPPVMVNAPVVDDVDCVLLLNTKEAIVAVPATVRFAPIYTESLTPIPPDTTKAPVDVEVAALVENILVVPA